MLARYFVILLIMTVASSMPYHVAAQNQLLDALFEKTSSEFAPEETLEPETEQPFIYHPKDFTDSVTLQALDKITTSISLLDIQTNESLKFGNLTITLHSCWKAPIEEEPESKALVEVWEKIPGEPKIKRFHGWMFASSPSISALEHPVYDISLLKCSHSPNDSERQQSPSASHPKAVIIDTLDKL